jgi:hypothetical protein
MAILSRIQKTALEVVDFLYFYDLAALATFTEEKKEVYGRLNNVIDDLISHKKFFNEKAEIYRHFLLCGVEIIATKNLNFSSLEVDGQIYQVIPPAESENFNKQRFNIASQAIYKEVHKSGYDLTEFIKDIYYVEAITKLRDRSHDVCFRLVFQVLWSDTEIGIAHHTYKKFLDIGILKTDKYSTINSYNQNENQHLFLRTILFVEFEILRNKLHHIHDKPIFTEKIGGHEISEKRKLKREAFFIKMSQFDINLKKTEFLRIHNCNLNNKKSIQQYLSTIGTDLCHNRLFSDSQNWGSLLGVGYLLYYKKINPKQAIFSEVNNEGSCSDEANKSLNKWFGLRISARTLNDTYSKKIDPIYQFIKVAMKSKTDAPKYGFIGPSFTQFFYYKPEMSEQLNKILENIDKKS